MYTCMLLSQYKPHCTATSAAAAAAAATATAAAAPNAGMAVTTGAGSVLIQYLQVHLLAERLTHH